MPLARGARQPPVRVGGAGATEELFEVPDRIRYTVSCIEAHTHHFDVEIHIPVTVRKTADLVMPVWTPGSYHVEDFAGRVHGFQATDGRGHPIPWQKVSKTVWRVAAGASPAIRVQYNVFALDVDVHRSYLDDRRATVNGAGVYMYVEGRKDEPVDVTFRMPASWKRINTGLAPVARPARTYSAATFDDLVDCPVMMGNHDVETFTVRGVPHHVVLVGPGNHDARTLIADMKKIVEQGIRVFDELPYKEYTFFCELTPEGYGGLEHRNSTHMIFPRWGFRPRKDYVVALGLISHEYFHTWNVKRLRPAPLGPFDYRGEVYTTLLWFAEGFTSYYDLLLLRRGGCITAREYLDELGREIRRLRMSPGRHVQSLEESSLDTWIKLYKPTPDSPNTTISYYNKGCLFGMALDLAIRDWTANRRDLDDVMRLLYRRFYRREDRGVTPEDIEQACDEVAGRPTRALFDAIVRGRDEVDWQQYLRLAGLEIASKQEPPPARKVKPGDETARAYLGIRLKQDHGSIVTSQVIADGPAHDAGLTPGDELIALDGNRLDEPRLEKWLGQLPAGRKVELTIARGGVLRAIAVRLARRPVLEFSVQARRAATAAQKALYRRWAGEPLRSLDRPERGFDFRPREKIF
jgi:predicted metalloprotease with PDZ domain